MSTAMANVYPIYASPLKAKWQRVVQDAIESYEHKVDKLDIGLTLKSFEVEEDAAFKTVTLSGAEFNINWLKRQNLEVFRTSFHKEFPEYRFKLIKEKK